jgi:hypothetical protein
MSHYYPLACLGQQVQQSYGVRSTRYSGHDKVTRSGQERLKAGLQRHHLEGSANSRL